jgi:hypothetical protein
MRLLCLSDLLVGSRPLPPQYGQRLHSLVCDLRPDALWLLGNVLDGRAGTAALFASADVLEFLGWLNSISRVCPVHWLPSRHDRFVVFDSGWDGVVNRHFPAVQMHDAPMLLVPDGRPVRVVLMDGWQRRFWPRETPTLRQRLAGVTPPSGHTRRLIAHEAIRRTAREIAEDAHSNIASHPDVWGVIHGGDSPYFGTFDGFAGGCPGGQEWCVLIDLEQRELSGLVRIYDKEKGTT